MALGTSALILQKLATVVSELARNQVLYAGGGKLVIRPCPSGRRCMHVVGSDKGGGIKNPPEIMSGKYKSRSGLGLGILGTKRLSDKFEIETGPRAPGSRSRSTTDVEDRHRTARKRASARTATPCSSITAPEAITLAVIDGLGHGRMAALASHAAVEYLNRLPLCSRPRGGDAGGPRGAPRHPRRGSGGVPAGATPTSSPGTVSFVCGGVGNVEIRCLGAKAAHSSQPRSARRARAELPDLPRRAADQARGSSCSPTASRSGPARLAAPTRSRLLVRHPDARAPQAGRRRRCARLRYRGIRP